MSVDHQWTTHMDLQWTIEGKGGLYVSAAKVTAVAYYKIIRLTDPVQVITLGKVYCCVVTGAET